MDATDETGIITLTMDSKTVGGIALRHQEQTNSPTSFSTDWMTKIGIPEASDTAMGYMSSSSILVLHSMFKTSPMSFRGSGRGTIKRRNILY